jgi:CheY-like chemotaxis protein
LSLNPSLLVLIVDDYRDAADLCAEYLRAELGATTRTAYSAEEALAEIANAVPCVIIVDLAMPGMDGWEFARRIRTTPATMHVPLIAYTAYLSGDTLKSSRALFDLLLEKPCALPELRDAVLQLVSSEKPRSSS